MLLSMQETMAARERRLPFRGSASIAAKRATKSSIAGRRVVERQDRVRQKPKELMDGKDKSKMDITSSASTATETDAAWMAMSAFFVDSNDLFEDVEELPNLQQLSDSDDESDSNLDKLGNMFKDEETDDKALLLGNSVVGLMEKAEDLPNEAYTTIYMKTELKNSVDIDLYDSSALRHISGHHHCFVNFTTTKPHLITAADKCTFDVTGKGDMLVHVPNGNSFSRILLHNVLYAPTMGLP